MRGAGLIAGQEEGETDDEQTDFEGKKLCIERKALNF